MVNCYSVKVAQLFHYYRSVAVSDRNIYYVAYLLVSINNACIDIEV